ncbi:MAG: sulfatase [Phycisphaerales bacterium]|nr:MAG: sulfatase [Phycisphaerales bacterium]
MHHSRTNVLWLTICTLRADHLGTYGYKHPVSPTIDALARRGVLFEQALAAAPWTRPSMAAAMTGLYPRSLNIDEPTEQTNNRQLHDSFRTLAEALHDHGYYTIGITANPNLNTVFNFDQGYDHYVDTGDFFWRSGYGERKRTAEQVNADLLQHLQGPSRGNKFFAHLTYVDVHAPLLDEAVAGRFRRLDRALRAESTASYDRQVRYVDAAIADLLQGIRALGHEDTLVIITSDHGEGFGQYHPEDQGHGRTLYNSTIWVPFILSHPALERVARRHCARVELTCLMPTVLDLLGIEYDPPAKQGKSLKQMIYGPSVESPFPFSVVETWFQDVGRSALIWSEWKLIAPHPEAAEGGRGPSDAEYELYQFRADPEETTNLAASRPYLVRRMENMMTAWQRTHPPLVDGEELRVEVGVQTIEDLKALGYIR